MMINNESLGPITYYELKKNLKFNLKTGLKFKLKNTS